MQISKRFLPEAQSNYIALRNEFTFALNANSNLLEEQ